MAGHWNLLESLEEYCTWAVPLNIQTNQFRIGPMTDSFKKSLMCSLSLKQSALLLGINCWGWGKCVFSLRIRVISLVMELHFLFF